MNQNPVESYLIPKENNEDCLPCLFIQFCVIENQQRVSKILQIFSRQAVQMDALINSFVEEIKQRANAYSDDDGNLYNDAAGANSGNDTDDCLVPLTTVSRRGIPESILSNKLNRLTMATFDDEGKHFGNTVETGFKVKLKLATKYPLQNPLIVNFGRL